MHAGRSKKQGHASEAGIHTPFSDDRLLRLPSPQSQIEEVEAAYPFSLCCACSHLFGDMTRYDDMIWRRHEENLRQTRDAFFFSSIFGDSIGDVFGGLV